jgi:hypothetical protein
VYLAFGPPVKSLKYVPLILLNEADADHLDVLTENQVFLLPTTTTETTSSSKIFEILRTAIAGAQIANTNAGYSSPVKYHLASKNQWSKLTPGSRHVFPVLLANSLVGADNRAAPPSESTTPVIQTPPPRATPSSSKSKCSILDSVYLISMCTIRPHTINHLRINLHAFLG